ncbi:MAG: hypothetical protein JWO53_830 [Chlamydiia bacterium]|nr:hypothetical protein [Chlamydiia bacterium]
MKSVHVHSNSTSENDKLEHAISIIERFTLQHEDSEVPTLEHFELQNGTLELKNLSSIEKTLSCLMEAIFQDKRQQRKKEQKPLKGKLLQSVDTIKIALLKLSSGNQTLDKELQTRLLTTAHRYNRVVRLAKTEPRTFSERIKRFFFKAAGWLIDEELQASEIQFLGSPLPRKFTQHTHDNTSQKIASVLQATLPQRQEIDLFHVKAHTLLTKEELPHNVIEEALKSLRTTPIEAYLSSEHILSLRQTISSFPGETIELKGDFSRVKAMSIPISGSFRVASQAVQTGYPHPLQHVGITFSEKLLPTILLRPYLAPNVDALLKKKQEIAHRLLPTGDLNSKAKALLQIRKEVFNKYKDELLPLQKEYVQALFQAAGTELEVLDGYFTELVRSDTFFEEMSELHTKVVEHTLTHPITHLEQAWLSNSLKEYADFQKSIKQASKKPLSTPYEQALGSLLTKALLPISELFFSEKLDFSPQPLDNFSKKVLACTLNELSDFIYELEMFEATEKNMLPWIIHLLKQKIALFSEETAPLELANELEAYFLRSRG